MFERILLKDGSNEAERFLCIEDLVDMMFYYGEVHVLVSQFELKQLLTVFGEDGLHELITTGRLVVHPCCQHVGASRYGELESVGIFSANFRSIEEMLFNFHKETISDPKENERFVKRFSPIMTQYTFPKGITDSLCKDVENENLLSKATQEYIRQYYPDYRNIDDIHIKAKLEESSIMSFYKIDGNLRLDELNAIHRSKGYIGSFTNSTVLIALGETNIDCYLASDLKAEMITNHRWAEVYKLRMNEYIKQAEGSLENIDHFREMAANDFLSPGQSFVAGLINTQDLLKDLNGKDSVKFREWLSTIPDGQPLTGELYKDIQGQWTNKTWVKGTRLLSQIVTGKLNPIVGVAHSLLDGFLFDKLINGWKPSMFISNVLTKDSMKK